MFGKHVGPDIDKFLYYKDDLWLLSYLLKAYIDKAELDHNVIFQKVKDDLIEYNECIGIGSSDIILLVSWITQNSAISSAEFDDNSHYLLFVQMSPTLKYLCIRIRALVGWMTQMDEPDLVYKGPWVRSAQHRLFQTLETDYAFPKATCRSLVNLIWDFVNETFGEKIHEGQIVFHAASASEPPGKRISDIKTVPVHLTFHDRNDLNVLSEEGTSALRKHKVIRMANEALDQSGLLTQEDLAVLLCTSRRTIRRDVKELKQQGIDVPTRGTLQDIGPGVTHKSKVVKMWLEGYEYTDIERKTGHSGFSVQRYLSGFSKVVRFYSREYSLPEIRGLTDMSERLIQEYLDLYETFKDRPESQMRFRQILSEPMPSKKSLKLCSESPGVTNL